MTVSIMLATTVPVNSQLTLINGVIRAACAALTDCTKYSYSPSNNVIVQAPISPMAPTAIIASSAIVSTCDDVVLDATGSTGMIGNAWSQAVWTVSGEGGANFNTSTVSIERFLNRVYRSTSVAATIPQAMLHTFF
jgi:hypothetical protein